MIFNKVAVLLSLGLSAAAAAKVKLGPLLRGQEDKEDPRPQRAGPEAAKFGAAFATASSKAGTEAEPPVVTLSNAFTAAKLTALLRGQEDEEDPPQRRAGPEAAKFSAAFATALSEAGTEAAPPVVMLSNAVNAVKLTATPTATQSDTAHGGVASRAIDGNTDGNWMGRSVTHTPENQSNPWLTVDLGARAAIGTVKLYNRLDCCKDRILGAVVDVEAVRGTAIESRGPISDVHDMYEFAFGGVQGQFVTIRIPGSGKTLSLAEVEVYEYNPPPVQFRKVGKGHCRDHTGAQYDSVWCGADDSCYSMLTSSPQQCAEYCSGLPDGEPVLRGFHLSLDNGCSCLFADINSQDFLGGACTGHVNTGNGYASSISHATGMNLSYECYSFEGVAAAATADAKPLLRGQEDKDKFSFQLSTAAAMSKAAMEAEPPMLMTANSAVKLTAIPTATQSSTAYGGVASRAIDGNTDGNWNGRSVTHTTSRRTNPFWRVDLGTIAPISTIRLYNRLDYGKDRIVGAVLDIEVVEGTAIGSTDPIGNGDIRDMYAWTIGGVQGRYVQIRIPGSGKTLSLAEVEVYGPNLPPAPAPVEQFRKLGDGLCKDGRGNLYDYVGTDDECYPMLRHSAQSCAEFCTGLHVDGAPHLRGFDFSLKRCNCLFDSIDSQDFRGVACKGSVFRFGTGAGAISDSTGESGWACHTFD